MQPSRCVGCREPGLVPVLPDVVDVTRDFWLVAPAERRELWTFWPRLIGRIVTVEAMDTTASGSLRQPRFLKWTSERKDT